MKALVYNGPRDGSHAEYPVIPSDAAVQKLLFPVSQVQKEGTHEYPTYRL